MGCVGLEGEGKIFVLGLEVDSKFELSSSVGSCFLEFIHYFSKSAIQLFSTHVIFPSDLDLTHCL